MNPYNVELSMFTDQDLLELLNLLRRMEKVWKDPTREERRSMYVAEVTSRSEQRRGMQQWLDQ